jgi:hypothetical protein
MADFEYPGDTTYPGAGAYPGEYSLPGVGAAVAGIFDDSNPSLRTFTETTALATFDESGPLST